MRLNPKVMTTSLKPGVRLFSPLTIRGITISNRIAVSPMCQYSAHDGFANDWHLVHLGSRAVGGAGSVMVEATAVEDRGRITPGDLGIWKDEQIEPLARIARFCKQHGSVPGIQLAHAGRKASTEAPWLGGHPLAPDAGSWETVAPSSVPFDGYPAPRQLTVPEIQGVVEAFASAARRALTAGFDFVEIHGAHGYLLHEFLSPLSNRRTDRYGGSLENRMRLTLEVTDAIRRLWPERLPLFLRISASDWSENGWTPENSVELARAVQPRGVDLIDCSSGGNVPSARIPIGPGYQVSFAQMVRRETGILTGAVGMITEPQQAEAILQCGAADLIIVARELLREPYWPIKAAEALGVPPQVPVQYGRAFSAK
jgi:2,4-dienoyl-CoA reductase-like NADH-dependent reductase (Old Yellow Enzyme family)